MTLSAIFANLNCSDLARSTAWFATIFGREPDARPRSALQNGIIGTAPASGSTRMRHMQATER